MSTSQTIITIKQSVTFTLYQTDMTAKKIGEKLETPKCTVPCSDGLQWWIRWYSAGDRESANGHVSVFLMVNKPVKATFTFAVDGSSISWTTTYEIQNSPLGFGRYRYASHEQLRPLFRDGKLTITCIVEFDVPVPTFFVPRVFQLFDHIPMDVEFVMGSERVPAHKNFLTMLSPSFQAMFTHNTAESKSGKIKIVEFDFATVKAAIDICYGREPANLPVETVVGILRFCDMYFITAVINELEKLPLLNPLIPTFCTIVHYAYDCNKDSLLTDCYNFFKNHQDEIKAIKQFADLPPALIVDVLKSAFGLKTDFDVLRHAHKNGLEIVVIHLEKPLLNSLTIDNFCDTVCYAWDCSREELQQACAKFLNENRDEVLDLRAFYNLAFDVVGKVLKATYVLKQGGD
uniref:BTB domain-containing protein n=1 Tax=Panagrellus redivivus TaxID=6233 RepID=A0A7E4W2X5_PANRE